MAKRKPEPQTLLVTNKTLRYGSQTYQIRNLTHVAKYEVERKYEFSVGSIFWAALVCLGSIYFVFVDFGARWGGLIITIVAGSVAAIGVVERLASPKYAFGLETSAGSSKLFSSADENFIDDLVSKISFIMDNDNAPANYTVNIADHSITDNSETVMGDKFQNISRSNISNVKDSLVEGGIYVGGVGGGELDNLLNHLGRAIQGSPNGDAAKSLLASFQVEIKKNEPDKSLLGQYLQSIATICPQVIKLTDSLARIVGLIS